MNLGALNERTDELLRRVAQQSLGKTTFTASGATTSLPNFDLEPAAKSLVPVPVSGAVESFSTTLTSPEDKVEALRRVTVFADLPEDQLKWFGDNAEDRRVEPGEVLFRKGDRPEWMAIYLEGEIHAYRDESAHDGFVFIARAGDHRGGDVVHRNGLHTFTVIAASIRGLPGALDDIIAGAVAWNRLVAISRS